MYGSDDPRSKLKPGGSASAAPYAEARALRFAAAEYIKFHEMPPRDSVANAHTWYARGQNFVLAYTEANAGAVLARENQVDEYVLILPERGVDVTVSTPQETRKISGHSLVIIPPGESRVTVHAAGKV